MTDRVTAGFAEGTAGACQPQAVEFCDADVLLLKGVRVLRRRRFTGHTLMVGDMGRTELAATAEEGARALAASAERLRTLPDHVVVLPGAFSGSVCGRGLSGTPLSTIGFERRFNRAFGVTDVEAFVALMLRDIPPPPPRAAETRAINMGTAAALATAP